MVFFKGALNVFFFFLIGFLMVLKLGGEVGGQVWGEDGRERRGEVLMSLEKGRCPFSWYTTSWELTEHKEATSASEVELFFCFTFRNLKAEP